jgi:hypothetical protein
MDQTPKKEAYLKLGTFAPMAEGEASSGLRFDLTPCGFCGLAGHTQSRCADLAKLRKDPGVTQAVVASEEYAEFINNQMSLEGTPADFGTNNLTEFNNGTNILKQDFKLQTRLIYSAGHPLK